MSIGDVIPLQNGSFAVTTKFRILWLIGVVIPILTAGGLAVGLLTERETRSLDTLSDRAARRLPGLATSVASVPARSIEKVRAALGPGPWEAGPSLSALGLRLADEDPLIRTVLVVGPDGTLILPLGPPVPRLPPPFTEPETAVSGAPDSPEALYERARGSAPIEADEALRLLGEKYGPLPAPRGMDWSFSAQEGRIRQACLLGRSGDAAGLVISQAERLELGPGAQGPAAAAVYLRRFLGSPAIDALAPADRESLRGALEAVDGRAAREASAAGVRTAWNAAFPVTPSADGWFLLGETPGLLAPAGAHGSVGLLLDAGVLAARWRSEIEAQGSAEFPCRLRRGDEVVAGRREFEVVAGRPLGFPWGDSVVETGVAPESVRAVVTGTRTVVALVGIGVAIALAAALAGYRMVRERLRLARLRTDFVASVSHDLRTPVTSIRMFAETIAAGRRPGKESFHAGVILREALRLERKISRILAHVRSERGESGVRPRSCDLARIVSETVAEFVEVEGRTVTAEIPDDPVTGEFDPDAVAEALWNLLENAARYSPDGSPIEVRLSAAGDRALLAVADRGVGIPGPERARVFEPYFRGSHPRVKAAGGTGLGLARVREVALALGGSVTAEDREGGGSVFVVRLPAASPRPSRR